MRLVSGRTGAVLIAMIPKRWSCESINSRTEVRRRSLGTAWQHTHDSEETDDNVDFGGMIDSADALRTASGRKAPGFNLVQVEPALCDQAQTSAERR